MQVPGCLRGGVDSWQGDCCSMGRSLGKTRQAPPRGTAVGDGQGPVSPVLPGSAEAASQSRTVVGRGSPRDLGGVPLAQTTTSASPHVHLTNSTWASASGTARAGRT